MSGSDCKSGIRRIFFFISLSVLNQNNFMSMVKSSIYAVCIAGLFAFLLVVRHSTITGPISGEISLTE